MPKSKLNGHYRHKIETELSRVEHETFMSLCNQRNISQSALAREALISYLNYIEVTREKKWEREAAQNIKCTTDRICALLAKQGTEMGVLLELSRQNLQEFNLEDRYHAAEEFSKESLQKSLEKRMSRDK